METCFKVRVSSYDITTKDLLEATDQDLFDIIFDTEWFSIDDKYEELRRIYEEAEVSAKYGGLYIKEMVPLFNYITGCDLHHQLSEEKLYYGWKTFDGWKLEKLDDHILSLFVPMPKAMD